MLKIESIQKILEDYRNDLKNTVENRDRMVQMANQQEVKMQQLMGAIATLEKVLKEEETPNAGNKNTTSNPEGVVAS